MDVNRNAIQARISSKDNLPLAAFITKSYFSSSGEMMSCLLSEFRLNDEQALPFRQGASPLV